MTSEWAIMPIGIVAVGLFLSKPAAADDAESATAAPSAVATETIPGPIDESTDGSGEPDLRDAVVIEEKTLVFDAPDMRAGVMRLLYVGEVVRVGEETRTEDGRTWLHIYLGRGSSGYVLASNVSETRRLPIVHYRPERNVREELPLGVGLRFGGPTMGAGLMLRYHPFSRLGVTFGIGSVLATRHQYGLRGISWPARGRGMTYLAAISSYLVLWNVSPFLELGVASINFDKGGARASFTTILTTGGVEMMLDMGAFVGVEVTFVRSIGSRISYEFQRTWPAGAERPTFEPLNVDEGFFHSVEPGFHCGVAF